MSRRPLRTNAADSVIVSSTRWTLRRTCSGVGRRRLGGSLTARTRWKRCARSTSSSCRARTTASSTSSEIPRTSPPLQLRVVLHTDPGELRHVHAPQARHRATPAVELTARDVAEIGSVAAQVQIQGDDIPRHWKNDRL